MFPRFGRASTSKRFFLDLFYSYSTCNSTVDDWLAVENEHILGGISINAVIATYSSPFIYKRNNIKEIIELPGPEYYDNKVPYEGIYIDYVNSLRQVSNGDIVDIAYTPRSKASGRMHKTSEYTAAVQDVADGLVDMAVGPFWITGERLKMTSFFTVPLLMDKSYLVVPRQGGTEESIRVQFQKVMLPFSNELWILILGTIIFAAFLSVLLSDQFESASSSDKRHMPPRQRLRWQRNSLRRRKRAFSRLFLDELLQKGNCFTGAGVQQESDASLSNKVLMFGFGFFILITVSAYVANLAAFLTRSMLSESITTMKGAVSAGYEICAHPALEDELYSAWPRGNFYFHQEGKDFRGMLDDYDAGKCKVLVIGWEDTSVDEEFLSRLCDRDLAYTDSIVAEIPVGFPIRSDLARGFSYWMYEGPKQQDVSIKRSIEDYLRKNGDLIKTCDIHLSYGDTEENAYVPIEIKNMVFPITFFGVCAVVAIIIQIVHNIFVRKDIESLMGRLSTLAYKSTRKFCRRTEKLGEENEDGKLSSSIRNSITSEDEVDIFYDPKGTSSFDQL